MIDWNQAKNEISELVFVSFKYEPEMMYITFYRTAFFIEIHKKATF